MKEEDIVNKIKKDLYEKVKKQYEEYSLNNTPVNKEKYIKLLNAWTAIATHKLPLLTVTYPNARPTKKAKGICLKFPCIIPKSKADTKTANPSPNFRRTPKIIPLKWLSLASNPVIPVSKIKPSVEPTKQIICLTVNFSLNIIGEIINTNIHIIT